MENRAEKAKKLNEHRAGMFAEFVEVLNAFSAVVEAFDTEEADNLFAYLCNMYTIALHKKA